MYKFKLSIITVNLNNLNGLQKTFDSIIGQSQTQFEFIVIDGKSTDGSREFLCSNSDKITYWVSEKDTGIYNAMNKGILKACGEYLLFLNSGDYFIDFNSLDVFFEAGYSQDIICADMKVVGKNTNAWTRNAPDEVDFDFFMDHTLPHQSTFIKKSLFKNVGLYDETLKYVSDWKFFIDTFSKTNATYKRMPVILCFYDADGISSKPENLKFLKSESEKVLQREYSFFYRSAQKNNNAKILLSKYQTSTLHRLVDIFTSSSVYKLLKKIQASVCSINK